MSYMVNPQAWGAVFPVPVDVVDKNIRLAGAVQLKVLLWMLRHSTNGIDIEKLHEDIGISKVDAEDALHYWIEAGIIISDNNVSPIKNQSEISHNETKKTSPVTERKKDIPYIKPNMNQIVARCTENPEIKDMFSEVQSILSKTIGHDGQSTLLMLHDSYGLPVEVILMLVEYCSSIGKDSFVYISKVGRDWGEKEIDTIEKADEQISCLRTSNSLWNELRQLAGIQTPKPTNIQVKFLNEWKNELGFDIDMIFSAYEEMANNCSRISFPYMDKVLKNWYSDNIKSVDDLEKHKSARQKSASASKSSNQASYDIDEFTKRALNDPLIYKKKEDK